MSVQYRSHLKEGESEAKRAALLPGLRAASYSVTRVTDLVAPLRQHKDAERRKAMKAIAVAALTLAMSAFAAGGFVQRPTQDQTSQPPLQQPAPRVMPGMGAGPMGGGPMGNMMGGGGAGQMGEMMARHQQMMSNMNKLMQSMAAIEAEKDPAALKAKLAEHRAVLEQMRSQMMHQGKMMQLMLGGLPLTASKKKNGTPRDVNIPRMIADSARDSSGESKTMNVTRASESLNRSPQFQFLIW